MGARPAAVRLLRWPRAWAAIAVVACVDVAWSARAGLAIDDQAPFFAVLAALLLIAALLRGRPWGERPADTAEALALFLGFAHADNLLSYLTALPAPRLQDAMFAGLDRLLWVDWPRWFQAVASRPALHDGLSLVYNSLIVETLLTVGWLAWSGRRVALMELFRLALATSLLTCLIAALLPALGPLSWYGLLEQGSTLNRLDVVNLSRLREGTGLRFAAGDMAGIVAFPSYHTVLALLLPYAARGTGRAGAVLLVWNLVMMAAIVPIGGHYLTDQIGGALLAALVIAVDRRFVPGPRPGEGRQISSVRDSRR